MENQFNPLRPPEKDAWLQQDPKEEIHVDPHADSHFIRPEDLELERILREHRDTIDQEDEIIPPAPEPEVPVIHEPVKKEPAPSTAKKRKPRAPIKKDDEKKKDPLGLPQLAATLIWMALILVIGLSIGRTLWAACTDVFAFGKVEYNATITIDENDSIDDIAKMLHQAKLIRYPKLFRLFAVLTDKDERISTGSFDLNSQLDYNAMINAMSANASARRQVELMFPEGYTCAQIFTLLEEEDVCTVSAIEDCLKDEEFQKTLESYWFLEGIELGEPNCLEGFLFPDTYKFYEKDDPARVLQKFLNAFDARFTDKMREDFEAMKMSYAQALRNRGYSEEYIEENALTLHKVIIIASMIEKETANDLESYTISSVIYNRLTNPGNWPTLGIDATLVYGLGGKAELTQEDLVSDHPYNTRVHPGLPPSAISNPGSNSLAAAVSPEPTSFYYYALDPKINEHRFFRADQENEFYNFLNSI